MRVIRIPRLRPCSLVALLLCLLASASTLAEPLLDDAALLQALRAGGHNIYFRHVATEWSQSDDVRQADDWRSCDAERMRQLSASGRADAETIGTSIRQLKIPVGEVLASPYCRTVETAKLMQLGNVSTTIQVMNMRAAEFVGGRASIIVSAQALLASQPPAGNRVIVAHGNVASAATPAYPQEGEALVFAPDGKGSFALRGRIPVNDWSRLLTLAD